MKRLTKYLWWIPIIVVVCMWAFGLVVAPAIEAYCQNKYETPGTQVEVDFHGCRIREVGEWRYVNKG